MGIAISAFNPQKSPARLLCAGLLFFDMEGILSAYAPQSLASRQFVKFNPLD
jgi:hypothetical protein